MQHAADQDEFDDVLLPGDSIGRKLRGLRRATLSIPNRLRSIADDASFVREVADSYGLPLIANERCGSWYVPPARRETSAYFKSTDGHTNQWAISSRRLNLHVLDVVARLQGCIIVDSTRRGKSMPDALSKTVPIWCAVMNRLLFPEQRDIHRLHTPPKCVSAPEHGQIEQRLDDFVHQLEALNLDLSVLSGKLGRPLRPLWVTRESTLPEAPPAYEHFHPVVLCTASRRVTEGDVAADGYVQGAGDDNEGWSKGLTADLFWRESDALLAADEAQAVELIRSLLEDSRGSMVEQAATLIKPTAWLYIGSFGGDRRNASRYEFVIHCGPLADEDLQSQLKAHYLHLKCRVGKLGSRDLRQQLPRLNTLKFLGEDGVNGIEILVCDESGPEHAIGVALAMLCLHDASVTGTRVDKDFIRQRLAMISTSLPQARPSRATLQSVNDFLMSGPTVT